MLKLLERFVRILVQKVSAHFIIAWHVKCMCIGIWNGSDLQIGVAFSPFLMHHQDNCARDCKTLLMLKAG